MQKLEKYYRKLLSIEKELQEKLWNKRNENTQEDDYIMTARLEVISKVLAEFKFIYSKEIEVIDGYCIEFKVK